jgi:hypothetical protein
VLRWDADGGCDAPRRRGSHRAGERDDAVTIEDLKADRGRARHTARRCVWPLGHTLHTESESGASYE